MHGLLLSRWIRHTGGVRGSFFDIDPRPPQHETCREGRRVDIARRDERRLTHSAPEGLAPWVQASASPPFVCLTALRSRNTFAREAPAPARPRLRGKVMARLVHRAGRRAPQEWSML